MGKGTLVAPSRFPLGFSNTGTLLREKRTTQKNCKTHGTSMVHVLLFLRKF
jgi:hypothetical protein